MKVELNSKELGVLIGLAYQNMNKLEHLISELNGAQLENVNVSELQEDYRFFKNLYEKLGSQIEL